MFKSSRVRVWRTPIFMLFVSLWVAACGKAIPVDSSHSRIADDTPTVGDGNSSKDAIAPQVRIAGSWSVPAKIASETANSATSDMLHGPQLAGDGSGNVFVDWRLHADLDAQTGVFAKGANKLFRYAPPADWTASSPGAAANLNNASKYDVVVNRFTGDAYATWREGNKIKVNKYIPGSGWGSSATDAGSGSWAYLANSIDDQTVLVVGEVDAAAKRTVIRVLRNNGADWALDDATLVRDTVSVSATRPALFANVDASTPGTLLVAWVETNSAGDTSLWVAGYSVDGWSTPVKMAETNTTTTIVASPYLLIDNSAVTAQLLFYSGTTNTNGVLNIAGYDAASGWGTPRLFDSAQRAPRKASNDLSVSVDDFGNAVVAWREETVVSGISVNGIYTRTYTAKKGWNVVRRASALGRLSAGPTGSLISTLHSPQVKLNATSVMALTWVEDTVAASEVLVSYADFAANPLWPLATELVVLYNTRGVTAETPQIALNDSNGLVVVWRQATVSTVGTTYTMWSSGKGTQQGQAVDVTINPSPQPQPNPSQPPAGHSTLTTGCSGCHDNKTARGKPANHIASKDTCQLCHKVVAWKPIAGVDHSAVIGTCVSCHNNVVATGKPVSHIAATDKCGECHDQNAKFKPVAQIKHSQILGDCVSCHNPNSGNTAKPATHIAATDACQMCHRELSGGVNGAPVWKPVLVDHTQVVGSCVSCHNSTIAKGKPATHLPTSNNCGACHRETSFAPMKGFDHTETTAACADCHSGTITGISGKSSNHVSTTAACDTCHSTSAWRPATAGGGSGGSTGGGNGTISGTWSEPLNVVTVTAPTNTVTQVAGPVLAWGDKGTGFVSLRKNSGFDFATGLFSSGSNIVKRYDATAQNWVNKSPVPSSQSASADAVQIQTYGNAGNAYALWATGLDLYFSRFNGTTWSTAEKVGQMSRKTYRLFTAKNGAAAIVQFGVTDAGVMRYTPGAASAAGTWGADEVVDYPVGSEAFPTAAMDSGGNILLAWMVNVGPQAPIGTGGGGGGGGMVTTMAAGPFVWHPHVAMNMVTDGKWANPVDGSSFATGPELPLGSTPVSLTLAAHAGNPLMIVQTDGAGNAAGGSLFVSEFDLADTTNKAWSAWSNIDYNVLCNPFAGAACNTANADQIVGYPAVSFNSTGDVIAIWTEKETIGEVSSYHVFSSFYSADMKSWTDKPSHVSMSDEKATMSAMDETQPSLKIDDTGHVTATWIASDGSMSKVLSNHYHKIATATSSAGWNASPELVASYDIASEGHASNPQVGTDAGGKAIVTWKQVVRQQFSIDFKVWSSIVP